jgi:hypothetical protein
MLPRLRAMSMPTPVEAMTINGCYNPSKTTEAVGTYKLLEAVLSQLGEQVLDFSILTRSLKSPSEISLKVWAYKRATMAWYVSLLKYAGMSVEDSAVFTGKCLDPNLSVSASICEQIANRCLERYSDCQVTVKSMTSTSGLL